MVSLQNSSSYEGIASSTGIRHVDIPLITSTNDGKVILDSSASLLTLQHAFLLALFVLVLPKALSSTRLWQSKDTNDQYKRPASVPSLIPIIGNLFMFLYDPQGLRLSQRFGKSGIVRLNLLAREAYIVSGAEYLNAIWKDSNKVMMSHDALNLSLSKMFALPAKEMLFFWSDRTGSSHDPHSQSPPRDGDQRVAYLMLKTSAEYLSRGNLAATAERYQIAMRNQLTGVPVHGEWVEMDDLYDFVRRLVANATCESILGSKFLAQFPDFVDNFYIYNSRIRRLLQGWPRFLIPRAWQARKRCIEIMRQWRKTLNVHDFDGSPMMLKRWSYFVKWNISDEAIASQDLGILWGTYSNAVVLTFWLCWHTLQDRQLLSATTAEIDECWREEADGSLALDATKLTSQPLLQSMHAEALRKYVAVYIARMTEYGDTHVLDYKIAKNKFLVINSAIAHMDERNWNLGVLGEYPVDKFWGERFLTRSREASHEVDSIDEQAKPKYSLSQYKGAWVPFGGGIHQCPARHWVKTKMLVSLAMITGTFEIELVNKQEDLKVDLAKYGLGALNPGEKAPFRIRRKRALV